MAKVKNRKLTIGNSSYLWNHKHRHHYHSDGTDSNDDYSCSEVVTVYQQGYQSSPLKIYFEQVSIAEQANGGASSEYCYQVGYPGVGIICRGEVQWNLNRPAVVTALIRVAYQHGWTPETSRTAFEFRNGFELIEAEGVPHGV